MQGRLPLQVQGSQITPCLCDISTVVLDASAGVFIMGLLATYQKFLLS